MRQMLYAVIIAGGSGTRFWPESRRKRPKQLLRIASDRSLLRATVERVLGLVPMERIMIVTIEEQCSQIRDEVPELSESSVVIEPYGRNTAPCIALAAFKLAAQDPEAVMLVLPADHIIGDTSEFLECAKFGAEIARSHGVLVTFGVQPTRPETGYGYIKIGEKAYGIRDRVAHRCERFVEKPDRTTAEQYVASGNYLWNSGMFLWSVSTILAAFQEHLPDVYERMQGISGLLNTEGEREAVRRIYAELPNISIDNGIMEVARNVAVIPLNVPWNDVGSWPALHDVWDTDACGNSARGDFVQIGSNNCVVSAGSRLVALVGVNNLVVVDTPDAVLVCHKDSAQDIKKLQTLLAERGYEHLL
ncbi:MAG: mannose-1-phosphate guanylyltransferase [Desulfomonilaceae bacterium]